MIKFMNNININKWELLSILRERCNCDKDNKENKEKYISGEELSKRFNVTRAAVWKCVAELKKLGYEIESKTNNGYKIIDSPEISDILNEYEILDRLKNHSQDYTYDVIYKKSTDSTNNDAKKAAGKNNLVVVSEKQTNGKGRYGRDFYSDNNNGIYFTIKINNSLNKLNIDDITFFPLIAAAAVSQAVSDFCGTELSVKWPNDLLYKSDDGKYKKLCGILTEASVEAENRSVSYVIVGIGLNVNNDISDFPDGLKDTASSLKIISGRKYNRVDILCGIIDIFTRFLSLPRESLLEEYKKRLLLGIDISFAQNGRLFRGRATGITGSGNLAAMLENGEETVIQSGEINFV